MIVGLLLLLSIATAESPEIFFKLVGNNEKCFIIDEPIGTLIHAHYKVTKETGENRYAKGSDQIEFNYKLIFPKESGKEPEQSPIDEDGVVMFTTKDIGEYYLCFFIGSQVRRNDMFNFYLNLEVGIEAIDYEDVAKTEQLNKLELDLQKQIDSVKALQDEINYQSTRHDEFQAVTESTIFRVKLFAFIQIFIFAGLAWWQYSNLKKFFRHIKVV
ncbi:GOLD domain-containing protein [Entamoeba marina]